MALETLAEHWANGGGGRRERRSASIAETAQQCNILLLASPWPATKEIIAAAGNLGGKILMDATNPLLPDLSGIEVGTTSSAGELVASWAPGAKVVKAFNTIGVNIMADPNFNGRSALLLHCGDDAGAKAAVAHLATELGFDQQDAGPLRQARLLEPLALLWISLAYAQGLGREFAFQIIKRAPQSCASRNPFCPRVRRGTAELRRLPRRYRGELCAQRNGPVGPGRSRLDEAAGV